MLVLHFSAPEADSVHIYTGPSLRPRWVQHPYLVRSALLTWVTARYIITWRLLGLQSAVASVPSPIVLRLVLIIHFNRAYALPLTLPVHNWLHFTGTLRFCTAVSLSVRLHFVQPWSLQRGGRSRQWSLLTGYTVLQIKLYCFDLSFYFTSFCVVVYVYSDYHGEDQHSSPLPSPAMGQKGEWESMDFLPSIVQNLALAGILLASIGHVTCQTDHISQREQCFSWAPLSLTWNLEAKFSALHLSTDLFLNIEITPTLCFSIKVTPAYSIHTIWSVYKMIHDWCVSNNLWAIQTDRLPGSSVRWYWIWQCCP